MNDVEIIMFSLIPLIQLLVVIVIMVVYLNKMQLTISNIGKSHNRNQEIYTSKPQVTVRPRLVNPQHGNFHNTTVELDYMSMI